VPVTVEATANCDNTPRVSFALEELGAAYTIVRQKDGFFLSTYGVPGPLARDGALEIFETNAILRHIGRTLGAGTLYPVDVAELARMDRWLDFLSGRFAATVAALATASKQGNARDIEERGNQLDMLFTALERWIRDREWFLDHFSILDCSAAILVRTARRFPPAAHPGLASYIERLSSRAAWCRLSLPSSYL
jgi:glutathione S-transferase